MGLTVMAAMACSGSDASTVQVTPNVPATTRQPPTPTHPSSPSPSPVLVYQPTFVDYVISLPSSIAAGSYEFVRLVDDYELMVNAFYIHSTVQSHPITKNRFTTWVSDLRSDEIRDRMHDVLVLLQNDIDGGNSSEKVVALAYPRTEADSLIVCNLAYGATRISPLVADLGTRDDPCLWDYADFLAGGYWGEGYVKFMARRTGLSLGDG